MPLCFLLALALLLPGCGDPKDQDTAPADGGTSDGGATDGGTSAGGATDGGTSDGGTPDGGTTDGGTEELDPAVPVEDLLIVSAEGGVYAWAAGVSAPGELASLPAISSARRGEDGTLNLVVDGLGWVDLDPTTGAELGSLGGGSGSYVSCGGLSWTVDSSSLAGRDETGVVLSVDLSVFDDTVESGAAVGRNLAAAGGVVYVGFMSEYSAWTGGWGAVDCGTGEVLSATGVRSVRRMLIDHGALVILGHEEGYGGAGGVWAWDLETGDALVDRPLGPTQAWGGRADGVQFAHYWASYIPTLGWWAGGAALATLPTIPVGDAHDNFVVLFDGDDPAQIWAVGEDGELDAYDLVADGDSWTLVELEVPALGLVQLIDTPVP